MRLFPTERLFLKDQYLSVCSTKIVKVDGGKVQTERTVAYPEGGGQEGDKGTIITQTGKEYKFLDTRKGPGRMLCLNDFPTIQVDTPIYHILDEEDTSLEVGMSVEIRIDVERRERLTLSHSASHLLLLAAIRIIPEAATNLKGCHIAEEYARFDFNIRKRFTAECVANIQKSVNEQVSENKKIRTYQHRDEPEAWYWEMEGEIIPCGGTHIQSTEAIGKIQIKRKNMGKGKERLTIHLLEPRVDTTKYHP